MANLSYAETVRWKKAQVAKLLGGYGKVRPVIGMADPFHYRYKVQTAFGYSRGRVVSGVWQSKEGRVAPVDRCLIEEESAAAIAATVRRLLAAFKLCPWVEGRGGFLRISSSARDTKPARSWWCWWRGRRSSPLNMPLPKPF